MLKRTSLRVVWVCCVLSAIFFAPSEVPVAAADEEGEEPASAQTGDQDEGIVDEAEVGERAEEEADGSARDESDDDTNGFVPADQGEREDSEE